MRKNIDNAQENSTMNLLAIPAIVIIDVLLWVKLASNVGSGKIDLDYTQLFQ